MKSTYSLPAIDLNLTALNSALQKLGLVSKIIKQEEEPHNEVLLIPMGMDEAQNGFILQLQLNQQQGENDELTHSFLSFLLTFPYQIPEKIKLDVMKFLFLANKSMPLQGLGFSEKDSTAYCLFTLPTTQNQVAPELLMGIIGVFGFVFDKVAPVVKDLLDGKTTYQKILAKDQAAASEK